MFYNIGASSFSDYVIISALFENKVGYIVFGPVGPSAGFARNSNRGNRKSPAQLENRIKPRMYVRRITRRTMHEKAPFC